MDKFVAVIKDEFPDEIRLVIKRMKTLNAGLQDLTDKIDRKAIDAFASREFEMIGSLSECVKRIETIKGNLDHCLAMLDEPKEEVCSCSAGETREDPRMYNKKVSGNGVAAEKDIISSVTIACECCEGCAEEIRGQQLTVFRSGMVRQRVYLNGKERRMKGYTYTAPQDEARALMTLFGSGLIRSYKEAPVPFAPDLCRWTITLSYLNRSGKTCIRGTRMPPQGEQVEAIIRGFAQFAVQPWLFSCRPKEED